MEYHNKILCVSFSELTDGIIKKNTLWSSVARKNIECVRRGGGEGCEALYAWTSIPEKYKRPFIEKYGDPAKVVKEQMIVETVRLDSAAREFYEEYTYEVDGERKHLTAKLVEEYTINASVLRLEKPH